MLKIIRIIVITFVIVFGVTFVFLLLRGKAIITGQLEQLTQKKVSINYVGLALPFNLEIKDLDIPGLLKVDYVSIAPSIPGLLSGKIVLNDLKLVNPQVSYEKVSANKKTGDSLNNVNPAIAIPIPDSNPIPQAESRPQKKYVPGGVRYLRLIIKNLNIKDGKIDFVDLTLPGPGIKITFKDINFHLTNLYIYPKSAITNFELSGRIPWLEGQEEGKIEAKGWVNLFKKDMQATVKIADIDGVYLYPYYATWVDLEKTRIQSAKLSLASKLKSTNNNLAAECHLELTGIVFKQRPEEEMDKAEKIANAVLDIFKALNQGKVVFNFTIKTRMTNPEFNFGYIKTAFEDRLREGMKYASVDYAELIKVPAKKVGRTAKDLSKALYNGTFGLVGLFKDTLAYAFKEEEKEEDE
ncbi:MAG: DUF748 domain-containing protein [Candidatus Omnitrophica bacterium]|nr:DUF748 domain-containing protein [Candidatus Omnitrophota bacterium]